MYCFWMEVGDLVFIDRLTTAPGPMIITSHAVYDKELRHGDALIVLDLNSPNMIFVLSAKGKGWVQRRYVSMSGDFV